MMSPEERARVLETLPGVVTWKEMALPEGDLHFEAKMASLDVLRRHFQKQRRRLYLGAELPVYYPLEPRFAPDILAVRGVDPHPRSRWVVSEEGKGIEWVLEVHVGGNRKKDAVRNVERYARLGIEEYFVLDRKRPQLWGYRLPFPGAREYQLLEPTPNGRLVSKVLGLTLQVKDGKLRFWSGRTLLPESGELIPRLKRQASRLRRQRSQTEQRLAEGTRQLAQVEQRLAEETRQRAQVERRLAKEVSRRVEAEQRLAQLQRGLEGRQGRRRG